MPEVEGIERGQAELQHAKRTGRKLGKVTEIFRVKDASKIFPKLFAQRPNGKSRDSRWGHRGGVPGFSPSRFGGWELLGIMGHVEHLV